MKGNKGFTLIELLVVIAIIGILASVVMSSLSSARLKGTDALVKTNMSSIASQAEIVYDTDRDYAAVCNDSRILASLEVASLKATGVETNYVCSDENTTWVASVPLAQQNQISDTSGEDYWCIQNAAGGELIDVQIAADAVACN